MAYKKSPTVINYASLGLISLCLLLMGFFNPHGGDEFHYYKIPLETAAQAWPALNTTELHYGLSPLWLWLTGFVQVAGLPPIAAGRFLSIIATLILAWILVSVRPIEKNAEGICLAILLLATPLVLTYGARAHPLMPGLLAAAIASCAYRHTYGLVIAGLCAFIAANFLISLAPFFAIPVLLGALYRNRTLIVFGVITCVAAALGVLCNWFIFGGIYPEKFLSSELYQRQLENHRGINWGLIPLALAVSGLVGWFRLAIVANSHRPNSLLFVLVAATLVGLFSYLAGPAIGPISSILARVVPLASYSMLIFAVGTFFMTLGWIFLDRKSQIPLLVAVLPLIFFFILMPFFYERFAFWAVSIAAIAVLFFCHDQETQPRIRFWTFLGLLNATLALALGYSFFGSL